MPKDHLSDFLAHMASSGNDPKNHAEIQPDDVKRRFALADDKGAKRSGVYQLSIDGDFAFGWYRSFKEGITHKWSAKSQTTFTHEERLEFKRRMKEMKARQEAENKILRDRAAIVANNIWKAASKDGFSEYLERKKSSLNGARVDADGSVIVPIYIDGKITSAQIIKPDGFKLFVEDGEIKSGYFPMCSKKEDLSIIVIVEGFSTGDAVRRSTKLPVIVAFNAGNLKPVALVMRKKYPQSKIIIAADNDAMTKNTKGEKWNPGIEFAEKAAAAVENCVAVWPEFEDKSLTDWNDALIEKGANYVKEQIAAAGLKNLPAIPGGGASNSSGLGSQSTVATRETWKEHLIVGDDFKIKKGSIQNLILFMKFHPEFEGLFAYNNFHHNIMLVKNPPWEMGDKFEARRLDDVMITYTAAALEKYGHTPDVNKVFKAIQSAADFNQFHPAQQYLEHLKWDGEKRLEKWLTYYLGCESEDDKYLAFIGKKWLTAGVSRIFEPGRKFDHVLVIEGEQGIQKSTALKKLATFGRDKPEEYFTDSVTIADIQNKDTIMKLQGSIIVELSELSGFSKKDDEEIKRWITLQHDSVRLPYAHETSIFKRQFILAASTNLYDYLKDPTGNRRYWPAKAGKIDIEALERDREQLWAEAVMEYKNGLYLGPTREEEALANIERRKRLSQDAWTDIVLDKIRFNNMYKFKISDLMDKMDMQLRDKDDRASRRIAAILRINGFDNVPKWDADTQRTARYWSRKDLEGEFKFDDDEEKIA